MAEDKIKSVITTFFDYHAEVDWDLTMKCNYSCSYCESYNNSGPNHFKSLKEYKLAISNLKKYFGNKKVRIQLLGGEPMLYKKWDEIVNLIDNAGFTPIICTNLSITSRILISKIKNLIPKNCIDVSWHTQFADENKIVENIELLNKSGHLRYISILADKRYWDKVVSAYNRVKHLDNVEISHIKDESVGKTIIASKLIDYTNEELQFIEKVNSKLYERNFNTIVTFTNGATKTLQNTSDFFQNDVSNFKGMKCDIGMLRVQIKPNGDVYPSACLLNYPKAIIGNIYEGKIKKPTKPIECPFNFCGCGPDMRINKYE